jgi:hypothetical protein
VATTNEPRRHGWPMARPVIDAFADEKLAAVRRLDGANGVTRVACGIDEAWLAAVVGRVSLLCIEDGSGFPARGVGRRTATNPGEKAFWLVSCCTTPSSGS